MLNMSLM